MLVRAAVPAWGALYELVARLELLGSDFERTLVRSPRIYPVLRFSRRNSYDTWHSFSTSVT